MLLGTYPLKLDEKGRIVLPAKLWERFSGGIVMSKGTDHCVLVYAERDFEQLHEKLMAAPVMTREMRDFRRIFLSSASQEIPDKQRRVTVPPMLRQHAALERDAVMIGAGDHAELWDAAAWEEFSSRMDAGYANADGEVIAGLF